MIYLSIPIYGAHKQEFSQPDRKHPNREKLHGLNDFIFIRCETVSLFLG